MAEFYGEQSTVNEIGREPLLHGLSPREGVSDDVNEWYYDDDYDGQSSEQGDT